MSTPWRANLEGSPPAIGSITRASLILSSQRLMTSTKLTINGSAPTSLATMPPATLEKLSTGGRGTGQCEQAVLGSRRRRTRKGIIFRVRIRPIGKAYQ